MPPVHIFILALLGGFIFITRWYPTRYATLRSDGYRLVFYSSMAGAIFLFLGSVVTVLLLSSYWGQVVHRYWRAIVPLDHSEEAATAFLLGSLLWIPSNWLGQWISFLNDKTAVDRAINAKQDPLELLLRRALGSGQLVSVTVKNGKVYIGTVQRNFNPAYPMESISLFLRFSGYRRKETLQLEITLDYEKTHQNIRKGLLERFKKGLEEEYERNRNASNEEIMEIVGRRISAEDAVENYEIVIPIGEIQSANMFDKRIYDEYFQQAHNKKGDESAQ